MKNWGIRGREKEAEEMEMNGREVMEEMEGLRGRKGEMERQTEGGKRKKEENYNRNCVGIIKG